MMDRHNASRASLGRPRSPRSASTPCSPSTSASSTPSSSRWTRPSLLTLSTVVLASLGSLGSLARAATFEPPGNQVLFGAWLDTMHGYSDTPAKLNSRLGYNVPVYQIAQVIPLPAYNYTTGAGGPAPENLIELSDTDAAVFLTVYPIDGFASVSNADFVALGRQILDYQINLNRTVFLRYAPEMQGLWNKYGNQPAAFNTSWHEMYSTISTTAPGTVFVWAPNTPQGYPYGQTLTQGGNTAADQALLDTNSDGALSAADNALDPYYPGDDVVDWIGISLYYKGPSTPVASDVINVAQTPGYCGAAINGTNPGDNTAISNWYTTYCTAKPSKACMIAECGAAYHVDDTQMSGSTSNQVEIQTAWINDCVTNSTFLDDFPRLKLIMAFEYEKNETSNALGTDDLRDFRMTNNTQALQVLQAGFAQPDITTRFSWAGFRAQPTSISSAGAPAATNSVGSTVVQQITATTRARPTTFPSLFGATSDGRSLRDELIELTVLVVSGVGGAWAVMRMV